MFSPVMCVLQKRDRRQAAAKRVTVSDVARPPDCTSYTTSPSSSSKSQELSLTLLTLLLSTHYNHSFLPEVSFIVPASFLFAAGEATASLLSLGWLT